MADFKALETFLWVVTLGSFRGAAQKLNTTQPAISQRIAQLEGELGVKLLQRDHRSVSPTPSGRQMMVYAEKLIRLRAEMLAVVGDPSLMRGVLRLGVAETIVHTWLPQLIKSVNLAYPNLSLEIEVDITPNLRAQTAGAGNRPRLPARPDVGPRRSQPIAQPLSDRLPRQPFARARTGHAHGRGSGEVSDHHLPAQDPALRTGALAVQPAGAAADPAARFGLARHREAHGAGGSRHRGNSRLRSSRPNWPTAGCNY